MSFREARIYEASSRQTSRQQGASEEELLRNYPLLNQQDLAEAWSYYRNYPQEIDQLIANWDEND